MIVVGQLAHLSHDRSLLRLTEIEVEVYQAVDRMCMRLGELLHEARVLEPEGFNDWVAERMPFGLDKAKRLIAIHLAYRELPEDVVHNLPRPWQAMFALRHWTGGRLEEAIEAGEIGPDTTIAEARDTAKKWSKDSKQDDPPLTARYSQPDLLAGKLMAEDPNGLNPDVHRALSRWVSRRTQDQTAEAG